MTNTRLWTFRVVLALLLIRVSAADSGSHAYEVHGVIERIASDKRTVTIHNQSIPGYMMEMTMDFSVRDPHQLDGFAPGDKVDFTLQVSSNDSWIENLQRLGTAGINSGSSAPPGPSLQPGDRVPDPALLSETGKTVHLSDFRGQVVIFTFFFTRCPLPNYCPLMSRNFAQTRTLLRSQAGSPAPWQFLSISFDSAYDNPANLASYARAYRGEDDRGWLFVAAPPEALKQLAAPLGLILMQSGNSISHNLRTVVLDPEGRLYKKFDDNGWTPRQLAEAVSEAAAAPKK